MNILFGEALRRLRIEKGFSQQQLSDAMHVDRSTVSKWESGDRMPDAAMISRLSAYLDADVAELLRSSEFSGEKPKVIVVDDERIVLTGSVATLRETMPGAEIVGFTRPAEALEYAGENRVALAFLDIEMGRVNGMDLCRSLLKLNPHANVIYLTAYREYAFDAWETGACGFLLKPLDPAAVRAQLARLRWPVRGLDA